MFGAWNSPPERYTEVKELAFGILTIFGSTISCEQAFSCMNIIITKVRSQLINTNLQCNMNLKTKSYGPDSIKLSNGTQSQRSH